MATRRDVWLAVPKLRQADRKAPKKIIALQMICIAALVGFSAWLFVSFGQMSGMVNCFLEQIVALKNVKGQAAGKAASVANMVPDNVISLVGTLVPLLAVIIISPAALIAVVEMLIVLCSCNFCKKSRMDEVCAKFLVFALIFILGIGIVCYLGIGAAGFAINSSFGQSSLAPINNLCDTQAPQLRQQLATANSTLLANQIQLSQAQASTPAGTDFGSGPDPIASAQSSIVAAQTELTEAAKAVDALDAVCKCIRDTFAILPTFSIPGLGCAAPCIVLFFLNLCTCCAVGICGGKKKTDAESGIAV